MILADTSILVQFLRGEENEKVSLFETLLEEGRPFGISAYTYAEVLQGAWDATEYRKLDSYLGTQTIYEPKSGVETFREAATVYYQMKRKGFTLRGLVDILIALTATHNGLILLHRDKDFEHIKQVMRNLVTL
jgi:predicted nucleic acid-binding protein